MPGTAQTASVSRSHRTTMLLIIGGAFIALLYFPVLARLVKQWIYDPNYRHGILIPLISALMLWRKRSELRTAGPGGGEMSGLILIALSAVLLIGGTAAAELFTSRLSLPILLIGSSLFLMGNDFTKKALFPLIFLVTMIPLPYIIYYKLTFPLQLMSAKLSALVLDTLQIDIIRKGNILLLPNYSLEVNAACSGLRSLITIITLALIFSTFSDLSNAKKVVLVAFAVPAAVAANTFRLTVTAIGAYAISPEFAEGILHQISGLIAFLAGTLLLLIAAGILKWIK